MTKRLFKRVNRTVEELDTEYVESTMTDAELAENAAERCDDIVHVVEDVADEAAIVNDGVIAVESLMATCRIAKRSIQDEGKGLSPMTVESINLGSKAMGAILRSNGGLHTLKADDFADEAKAIATSTKLANFQMESMLESVNAVMEATAAAVVTVADEVGTFMTTALQMVEAQNAAIPDLMARVQSLKVAGNVTTDATSNDPALAYIVGAAANHDVPGVLSTREAVLKDLIDNVTALPEHTLEHLVSEEVANPFATALETVYTPLMDGFEKVSQDTIPFVESGLDPAEWTPYMSKSFGLDGNAAILSVSVPFIQLASGEMVFSNPMSFEGAWFMECDVTGGSTTDVGVDAVNKVLDVVEMENFLSLAPMNIVATSDNLVEAAASMGIYMNELRKYFADHEHVVVDDPKVMVGLGMIVDFSEYLAHIAIKAIGQALGDTDRLIQACAVSIAAHRPAA